MKKFIGVLSILSAALLLTGCSGDKEVKGKDEKRLVTVYGRSNYEGFESYVMEEFEKAYPEIDVEFVEGAASTNEHYANVQAALMAEDEGMDVFYADVIWAPTFAEAKWIHPITVTEEEKAKYIKGGVDAFAYRGVQYGLPMFVDGGQLYYRKDLLTKYNKEVPTTWDKLVETTKYIVAEEKKVNPESKLSGGYAGSWKQYEGITCSMVEFVWSNGGQFIDADGNITVNTPEVINGLKVFKKVFDEIGVPGVDTFTTGNVRNSFSSGQLVFSRDWPSYPVSFERDKADETMELGYAPLPHRKNYKSASSLGGFGVMISNFSDNKKDAETFLKFRTGKLIQRAAAVKLGRAPSRLELYNDKEIAEKHPTVIGMLPGLKNVRPRPQNAFYNDISALIQQAGHDIIKEKKTIGEAVQWMETEMKKVGQ